MPRRWEEPEIYIGQNIEKQHVFSKFLMLKESLASKTPVAKIAILQSGINPH